MTLEQLGPTLGLWALRGLWSGSCLCPPWAAALHLAIRSSRPTPCTHQMPRACLLQGTGLGAWRLTRGFPAPLGCFSWRGGKEAVSKGPDPQARSVRL